jgi:two-component system, NtrC family, sensor kinase
MFLIRAETPLPMIASIINWSQMLLSDASGELYDDLAQMHESSMVFYERLEHALVSQEVKTNQLLHELRCPLNVVIGYAEIILDGLAGPIDETQRELLEKIHTHAMTVSARILEMYG